MADIRIDHATVVTMDGTRRVLEDGAVAMEGDRILAVGPTETMAKDHPAHTVIDGTGMAALPGLIDVHAHAGHGLIKTMGGGNGEAWYEACKTVYTVASDPEFWRAEAALAGLERLKAGVTTGVSLLGGGDSVMRTDRREHGDAHLDAVAALGIRVHMAIGPTRPPFPWTYAAWAGGEHSTYSVTFEEQIETCQALIRSRHGSKGQRLNIAMLSPTLRREHLEGASSEMLTLLIDQARAASAVAREHGLVFTQDGHKAGTVTFADEALGILGPEALLSHATDFSDEEIAICADKGVKIAHNPSAVASIMGRCRVVEMLDAGVVVGLGSDGTAPDRSGDMFRHMQQCMHYHRRHFRDASILPPGKVLEMATIDAARALSMEDSIGSLEVGKKADLILVDLKKPHLYPPNMPLYRIVCFANGADVDTTIVDGEILMQGRKALSVDEDTVLEDAARATTTMLERTGFANLLETPETFFGATRY
ncbi:MAG: amidohydrolase family protein [Pseudomonadota bacterium]